jgi:hypothetical protein
MLLASRLTEIHARAVQTLPAEPAGTGREVAAGPPAPGPALGPEVHDAVSATAASAAAQIRLATVDLPTPATASQRHYAKTRSAARDVPSHQTSTA